MVSKYKHKGLTWVDVESPTRDEIVHLMRDYELPELLGEELMRKSSRAKLDLYPHFIYFILHFPIIGRSRDGDRYEQEVDFVIGKDFLITAHYEVIDPIHEFSHVFEVNSILDKHAMGNHSGFVLFYILRELYKNCGRQLEEINLELKDIEKNIFANKEKEMVHVISNVNRKLLDFKQAIRFHKHILTSFESAGVTLFGDKFKHYLEAITGEYERVNSILESHKEILNDLRTTNDSLLTNKTAQIMKSLTLMAFMTFPLALIVGIFGMDTVSTPIVGTPNDFWVIIFIVLAAALGMLLFFKTRKWL